MADVVEAGAAQSDTTPAPDPTPAQQAAPSTQPATTPANGQQQASAPAAPKADNSPGPVPYERFKFVNDQLKQHRQELAQLRAEQQRLRAPAQAAPRTQANVAPDDDPAALLDPYLSPLRQEIEAIRHERAVDELTQTTRAAVRDTPDVSENDVYQAIMTMTPEQAANADPFDIAKTLQAQFDERFTRRQTRTAPAAPQAAQQVAAPPPPRTPPQPRSATGQFESPKESDRMPDGRSWRADPDERHRRALLARGLPLPAKYTR